MQLQQLTLTHVKHFHRQTLTFDRHLTVIVGENGAGKSTLLEAISILLSWWIARIRADKGLGKYILKEDITNGAFHAQIEGKFDCATMSVPNKAVSGVTKQYSIDIEELNQITANYRAQFENTNFKTSIPVFAFYGVQRAVLDVPLKIRSVAYQLLDTYKDSLQGTANFRDFFTWFRNQEDIENEAIAEQRQGTTLQLSEHSELRFIREALLAFMPEYTGVRVSRRPLKMLIQKGTETFDVAQLSDGEKIYFALIGDLAHRLVLANPTMNNPLEGEGIVLIDELDLHLHPKWQSEIAPRLTRVFPNVQFITTTHSPHVLNQIPKECIRRIEGDEIKMVDYSYGLPSEILLRDLMGLQTDIPQEVNNLLSDIYTALRLGNLKTALAYQKELEDSVPQHPDLVRIRKLIERQQSHIK